MIIIESKNIFNNPIAELDMDYPQWSLTFLENFTYKKSYRKGQVEKFNIKSSHINDLKKYFDIQELPYTFFDREKLEDVINFLK